MGGVDSGDELSKLRADNDVLRRENSALKKPRHGSALNYLLAAIAISVAVIVIVQSAGNKLQNTFNDVSRKLDAER